MRCKVEEIILRRLGSSLKGTTVDVEGIIEIGSEMFSFEKTMTKDETQALCDVIQRVEQRIINDLRKEVRGEA